MIATNGLLAALDCTKFVFGRGSAPDPAGGACSAPPDPLADLRGPTSKGRGGSEGKAGQGRGRERRGPSEGPCEGPRKVNLLHLVPSVVDSAFTISERSLCSLLIVY